MNWLEQCVGFENDFSTATTGAKQNAQVIYGLRIPWYIIDSIYYYSFILKDSVDKSIVTITIIDIERTFIVEIVIIDWRVGECTIYFL